MGNGQLSTTSNKHQNMVGDDDGDGGGGDQVVAPLPEDIIFHILLWLPVASILQLKWVCKSWLSLIESSGFIYQHFDHHHHHHQEEEENENLMVVSHPKGYFVEPPFAVGIYLLSSSSSSSNNSFQVSEYFELPPQLPSPTRKSYGYSVDIIASCNGLICTEIDCEFFFIFNPATKHFRLAFPKWSLPQYQEEEEKDWDSDFVLMEEVHTHTNASSTYVISGFGFDVKNNDYKVVRVCQTIQFVAQRANFTERFNQMNTQVEVYSLSTDSWKKFDADLPVCVVLGLNINAPFRNSIFCWLGRTTHTTMPGVGELGVATIFSFDFSEEVFETMPVPDVYANTVDFGRLRLVLLRDNIACIEWDNLVPWEKCIANIWMLNEYGVKESWTKLYTVWLEPLTRPIGVLNNGWIICDERDDEASPISNLSLCDPVTQETKNLPLQGKFVFKVAAYKESLVSFKRCNSCD